AAPAPAARGTGAGGPAPQGAGLPVPAPLLAWLPPGVLGPALGADRRGRRVPRSVLLARPRLHRDQQHLYRRTGAAGLRRRAHRPSCRPVPAAVLLVLPQHAHALPGPVPGVRPSGGDAGQGAVGLRLLLVAAGAAVLQRTAYTAAGAGPAASVLRRRAQPQPGDAGAAARLGPARCRAAAGCRARLRPVRGGLV